MKANFIIVAILEMVSAVEPNKTLAQFYPDSLANWCLYSNVSPDGMYYVMHMLNDPDTVINGLTYKRIDELLSPNEDPICMRRFYVRSAPDGKGFMYLPTLGMEYLTGDANVVVSDTLHNVLIANATTSCGVALADSDCNILTLVDVVVMSIDTITNAGVTVVRHLVWPLCQGTTQPLFWQAGIGSQHGPLLMLTGGLGFLTLDLASVGDTCYYNSYTLPQGLPGGPACCVVIENRVDEPVAEAPNISIYPNPSSGIFTAEIPVSDGSQTFHLTVQDALGRTTYTTTTTSQMNTVDLRGRSGLFLLIVEGNGSRWSTRIIIE